MSDSGPRDGSVGNDNPRAEQLRMDQLEEQMGTQGQKLNQVLEMLSALTAGRSGREESSDEGRVAGGNNPFVAPGARAGASAGAGVLSTPGHTPAVDPEGSQESGGLGSPQGERAAGFGEDGGFGGNNAVYNIGKQQLPRIVAPPFKGNRQGFRAFQTDFLIAANSVGLKDQFTGSSPVADVTKDKDELLREGFSRAQISSAFSAWNFLSAALQSENAKAIVRQCTSSKTAWKELHDVYSPATQGAKQEFFRQFSRFSFPAKDDPIKALNELEVIWSQLNDKDGVMLDLSFLLTKFIDILPLPEYESAQNSLGNMKDPTRGDVVRIVTTQREKIVRLSEGKKAAGEQQLAYTAIVSNGGGGNGSASRGRGGQGRGRGKKGAGGSGGKGGRCYRCQRKGHFAEDCTTRPEDFLPKCSNCSGLGHKEDKCPSVEEQAILAIAMEASDSETDVAF